MTQKAKVSGLTLIAVLTVSAIAASAVQAAGAFTAERAGNAITGSQIGENVFTTTHGTWKCSTRTFSGTTTGVVATEMKLTPIATGCKFAGLKMEVTPKTCFYRFTAGNTVEASNASKISATIHLECSTAGDSMTIEIPGSKCVATVPPQTIENGIILDNSGTIEKMDIRATLNIVGIDYNVDEPTSCPNPSDITSHTEEKLASYVGEVTLEAVGGLTVH